MGNRHSTHNSNSNVYSKVKNSSISISTSSTSCDLMISDNHTYEEDELKNSHPNHTSEIEMYQSFMQHDPNLDNNEQSQLLIQQNSVKYHQKVGLFEKYSSFFRNSNKISDNHSRIIIYNGVNINKPSIYRSSNNVNKSSDRTSSYFLRNSVNNQKYSLLSFFPLFLYEQFNQFWNIYFLFVALTQVPIPNSIFEDLWIGYWWTWVLPLTFVIFIAMLRELFDDIQRKRRDLKINYEKYNKISSNNKHNIEEIASCDIKIGDLIVLNEGNRVPCDMILLWCSNENGTTFIKTDQLDGETDWKLRKAIPSIHKYYNNINSKNINKEISKLKGILTVEPPHLNIYEFIGKFENKFDDNNNNNDLDADADALDLKNTLWSSTRIASGSVIGIASYLGKHTRSQLNSNEKQAKTGKIDKELNYFAKILFIMMISICAVLTFFKGLGFYLNSYIFFGRFLLLLSAIIPISLKVHMDLSKIFFSYLISKEKLIPNTTVRCTTIPEELGRIQYIFSDKTGTLTKNEMIFQKLQLKPPLLFHSHHTKLIHNHCLNGFAEQYQDGFSIKTKHKIKKRKKNKRSSNSLIGIDELEVRLQEELKQSSKVEITHKSKLNSFVTGNKSTTLQVSEAIEALALCHNVTPILNDNKIDYEASSPDEVAMVKFTETIGVKLIHRTSEEITLRIYKDIIENIDNEYEFELLDDETKHDDDNDPNYFDVKYEILNIFPFTSESKRMGIIIKSKLNKQITFYSKGADVVMKNMIQSNNDFLDEEVENLSREGLRTLVFAKKVLTSEEYDNFLQRYNTASISMNATRNLQMESVKSSLLEQDMELLCISGVEDKLQDNVQSTIEILRNAWIKIWMLTGDKIETAKVIARSSRLISYGQEIYELIVNNKRDGYHKLDILYGKNNSDLAIVIDGKSLDIFMNSGDEHLRNQFLEYIITCNVVICCRNSPTQKAEMVKSVQNLTNKICLAIGDGGNDVSMILAANVGVGILGKEGQQASLSSDFSIHKFEYLSILLLWYGRLSYKNTSKMSQFVIHRGLIIAFIQVFFSIIFYFSAVPIFTGALAVGYTCFFTSLPVFSLVLDRDISFENVLFYPELYHDLQNGLSLNKKTFLLWILRSFFQGSVIMLFTLILFENELHNIISIAFTSLILTELFNVYLEINKLHILMIISELLSILMYIVSVILLSQTYFDEDFVFSSTFILKSILISSVANIPVFIIKYIRKKCNPSLQAKLKDDQQ